MSPIFLSNEHQFTRLAEQIEEIQFCIPVKEIPIAENGRMELTGFRVTGFYRNLNRDRNHSKVIDLMDSLMLYITEMRHEEQKDIRDDLRFLSIKSIIEKGIDIPGIMNEVMNSERGETVGVALRIRSPRPPARNHRHRPAAARLSAEAIARVQRRLSFSGPEFD